MEQAEPSPLPHQDDRRRPNRSPPVDVVREEKRIHPEDNQGPPRKRHRRNEGGSPRERYLTERMKHKWTIISKPPSSVASTMDPHFISGADKALSVLQPDVPGRYVLQLTTQGHGTTYEDTIDIWVLDKNANLNKREEEELEKQLNTFEGYIIERYFAPKFSDPEP